MCPGNNCVQLADVQERLNVQGGVAIPFPDPKPRNDTNLKFAFAKPANINVVGSYARKTYLPAAGITTIDLAVTLPSVRVWLSTSNLQACSYVLDNLSRKGLP